jgi:hypothetical protein
MTAASFAAASGIGQKQLHNWAYRLGMTGDRGSRVQVPSASVRLLRVVRRSAGSTQTMQPAGRSASCGITLRLVDGAVVELQPDFDEGTLRKVLKVSRDVSEGTR